jgi:hypothetical protein
MSKREVTIILGGALLVSVCARIMDAAWGKRHACRPTCWCKVRGFGFVGLVTPKRWHRLRHQRAPARG